MNRFKLFDLYNKVDDEFRVRTSTGGTISIIAIILIIVLIVSEVSLFLKVDRYDELYVDVEKTQKIPIYINITFPSISCEALSLDVMDVAGEYQVGVQHTFYKQRLNLEGKALDDAQLQTELDNKHEEKEKHERAMVTKKKNYCGSCYGAEDDKSQCCNTCEDVKAAYRKKAWKFEYSDSIEQCYSEIMERRLKYAKHEGCRLSGNFLVNKVAGNFHFAPGRALQTSQSIVHDFMEYEVEHFNTSHIIHNLGFGEKYPGLHNPLDDVTKTIEHGSALYQYFIKVVPTIYEYNSGTQIKTNQYAVTQHMRPRNEQHKSVVPGVFFMYDLNPIMVHIHETRKSFLHFLTQLCAIVGGVFSISTLFDHILYKVTTLPQQERDSRKGPVL